MDPRLNRVGMLANLERQLDHALIEALGAVFTETR
jgi:hypothetical protein